METQKSIEEITVSCNNMVYFVLALVGCEPSIKQYYVFKGAAGFATMLLDGKRL